MGADLILTYTEFPRFDPDVAELVDFNFWENAKLVGHARIDAYDFTNGDTSSIDLIELAANYGLEGPEDLHASEEELAAHFSPQLKAHLHEVLNEVLLEGRDRRDVTVFEFNGIPYWFSGGMSWGDTPTEAYDMLVALDLVDLFYAPITADEIIAVAAATPPADVQ